MIASVCFAAYAFCVRIVPNFAAISLYHFATVLPQTCPRLASDLPRISWELLAAFTLKFSFSFLALHIM